MISLKIYHQPLREIYYHEHSKNQQLQEYTHLDPSMEKAPHLKRYKIFYHHHPQSYHHTTTKNPSKDHTHLNVRAQQKADPSQEETQHLSIANNPTKEHPIPEQKTQQKI